jgi:serine/threonine-protein kinase PknK
VLLALSTLDFDLQLGRHSRAFQRLEELAGSPEARKNLAIGWAIELHRAQIFLAAGEWAEAERKLQKLLAAKAPGLAEAWRARLLLWRARFRQDNLDSAAIGEELADLGRLEGESLAAEHRLWRYLVNPLSPAAESWTGLLDWIAQRPLPDWRREAGLDLALAARRRGREELKMENPKIAATMSKTEPNAISETRFRQFCEINRRISERAGLDEILERVMDAAIELSGAERGFLLLKESGAKQGRLKGFRVKTARRLNRETLEGEELEFSWTLVEAAFRQGAPLLTDNAQADERFREARSVVQFQLKAVLIIPMELDGEPFGALYLDHRYEPDCFDKQDLAMLSALAVQASLAIEKARMLEELRSRQERLEARVKDQEQQLDELSGELSQARKRLKFGYEEIVGKSRPMLQLLEQIDHVAPTKIPVWIFGESGTGKELVARALHHNSPWKNKPFVSENCGAIPETLLESELFGHKRGAFTQADRDRVGLIQQSDGGTLFLDEVADMSLGMQAKLLRVLQESTVRPLGSNVPVKVELRLVTASNRDLEALVKEGKFRQDLFFRINGLTLRLPSLRERREDIPVLAHHLIQKLAKDYRLKPSQLSQDAVQWLMERPWPGNVRELESVLRAALLFAAGRRIDRKMLEAQGLASKDSPTARSIPVDSGVERDEVVRLLRRHDYDKKKIAEELGLTLKSVYNMLEKAGLPTKKSLLMRALQEV